MYNKKLKGQIRITSTLQTIAYLEISIDGGNNFTVVDQITVEPNVIPDFYDFPNRPTIDVDNPLLKIKIKVVPQTTTTTSSTTTTTTTLPAASPFRYANSTDVTNIPNASLNDMLLTGANITKGEVSIDIRPSFGNTFTLDSCKKILIKGGNYDRIRIEIPGLTGTTQCPIIITNYDGQVRCKTFSIVGVSNFKLTGKYDPVNKTGDPNYVGHANGYAYSQGKYGIFVDNQWDLTKLGWFLLSVQGLSGSQSTGWEVEYVESGNGGFSNVFKTDNVSDNMDNISIHDVYIHDTHGEGVYLGSTANDNRQHLFTSLKFYNNRILRTGNEAIQLNQLSSDCLIENNVIHGAVNWKSPFGEFQDNASQLGLKNGRIIFRNNIVLNGGEKWGNYFTGNISNQTGSGNIEIYNNVYLYCHGPLAVYFGQSNYLQIPLLKYNDNWHGKFTFEYDEVYTGTRATNSPHLIRIANDNFIELKGNKWDGTGNKSTFYNVVGGSLPIISAEGNELTNVPDVQFVDYMFDNGFDYLLYEEWASKIGDTWGDENQFGFTNTKKGQPVVYKQGDIVSRFSKFYRSLQNNNSLIEPAVTAGWQSWWEPIIWTKPDSSASFVPADDVRLISTSFYNGLGIGLKDNEPYNGPSTTTSSTTSSTTTTTTSSSTTTTTTTLGLPPAYKFNTYAKDNANNTFDLLWGANRNTLINSPKLVAIGSSTLVGVGATTGNGLPFKLQQYLDQYSGTLFNLSKSATDTSNWMPTGNNSNVDEHRNVTAALMANPNFALIVTASNDIISRTPEEALANLVEMYNTLTKKGIVCFIEACQPRSNYDVNQQNKLMHLRDLIISTFPTEIVIDVIPSLKDNASSKPCDINPIYNADGTHLNDAGIVVLTNLITAKFEAFFVNSIYDAYQVEKSINPVSGFALFDTIIGGDIITKTYPRIDGTKNYYRVRGGIFNSGTSDYDYDTEYTYVSNGFEQLNNIGSLDQTVQIDFSIDTNGPPPTDWNNFNAPSTGATIGYILENLVDSNEIPTNIVCEVTRAFSGANTGGSSSGLYPAKVMQDSWNVANNTNKIGAELRIGGLSTNYLYTIEILSSRSSDQKRYLGFRSGDNYNYTDANIGINEPNQYNTSFVQPLIPDSVGNIFINFVSLSSTGYLNSIVLRRYTIIPPGQTTTTSSSTTTTSSTSSSTTTTTTTIAPITSTVNVNVYSSVNGGTPYGNVAWNDWNIGNKDTPTGITNIKLGDGTSTGINISTLGFDGYVDNGSSYGGGIFPAEVLRYGIYTTNGPTFGGNFINFILTGLDNSKTYTFEFIGSRANVGNSTLFQAIGTTTVTSSNLVTDSNKNNTIFINNVTPVSGEITLKIRKNSGSTFAYINGFKIYINQSGPSTTTTSTTSTSSTTTTSTTLPGQTSTTSTTTTSTTTLSPGLENDTWTVQSGSSNPWFLPVPTQQAYVYTPAGYNNGNQNNYPAIIFLHGSGERGTNIQTVLNNGLSLLINNGQNMDSIVICPQLPDTFNNWNASYVKQAYDWLIENYRIDTTKVYVTGLSLGATGASDFVGAYPQLIAAYLVAAGTYDRGSTVLNNKKDIPSWYHHGDRDTTQNTGNTASVITSLNALTPKPKYPPLVSIYSGLAHVSAVWNDNMYDKSKAKYNFEKWLLLHSKNDSITATNYVTKAEETEEIHDYNEAKRLTNLLPEDSNKISLLDRLVILKEIIDGNNKRFIIDLGATTSIGNINSITSGATGTTISNIVDEDGNNSTFGFTVVQRAAATGSTEGTNIGLENDYFGYPYSFYADTFNGYSNGGSYKFTNLNNAKKYSLRIYTSKDKVSFTEPNMPSLIIGNTVKYFYANYNTTEWIEFNNLTPSSGEITFLFKGSPTLNAGVTPTIDPSGAFVVNTSNVSSYKDYTVYINGVILVEENNTPVTTTTSTSSSTTTTTTTQAGSVNPQFLTQINSWNAYVKLPDDYYTAPTKYYPTIVFFPGLGQTGVDASLLLSFGPNKFIAQGWNGTVDIDGTLIQPILISLQPPSNYPTEPVINTRLQTIITTYRVDVNRLHLTGLSHGGWCCETFVTGDQLGGPYNYANMIASIVPITAVVPDDNKPYPQLFANYANAGGKYLGFEQIGDLRDMQNRVNTLNNTVPNTAVYIQTNFGGGGHCCWDNNYSPASTFNTGSRIENIYQWMCRQIKTSLTTTTSTSTSSSTTTTTSSSTSSTSSTTSTTTTISSSTTTSTSTSSTTTTTTTTFPATIAQFNFNATAQSVAGWADVSGNPWNANPTGTQNGITVTAVGQNTKWGQQANTSATNTGGQSTGNNSGMAPDNVLISYWYNNGNTLTPVDDNVEISGLVVGATYTIEIFASRGGVASRIAAFRLRDANGSELEDNFNVGNNTATIKTFTGKISDGSGKLYLTIKMPSTGTTGNGNMYGYLNGMRVTRTA